MGLFERYLTVWVALGIAAGVGLGLLAPEAFQLIARLEFAQVNLVPDVSRYGNQEQARTIAHSMVPVLLAALQPEAA